MGGASPAARLLLGGLLLLGCVDAPGEGARLRAALRPHLDAVEAYDGWARRLGLAEGAFRSDASLEEAAFAPLASGRGAAVAAWITLSGPRDLALRWPGDAPGLPEEGWRRARLPTLGPVELRAFEVDGRAVVLLRRERESVAEGRLAVTQALPIE
jgi:hypothetical protein